MAFLSIPNPTDKLKISQGQIKTNFDNIKTAFDVNHEALTGLGANEGKHKFVNLTNQAATGDPASAASQITLYQRVPATAASYGTSPQIFIVRDTSYGVDERYVPLTAGDVPDINFEDGEQNYSFFGSGLMIKQGVVSGVGISGNNEAVKDINLTLDGPNFQFLGGAWAQLMVDAPLNITAANLIVYVDYGASTVTSLRIRIRNTTLATTSNDYRLSYLVIGAADLTNT